jgi:hypothetical protein
VEDDDLIDELVAMLVHEPGLTAQELARDVSATKAQTNSVLYRSTRIFTRSSDIVPRWYVRTEVREEMASVRLTKEQRATLLRHGVDNLFSLQPLAHLKSIEEHGILSRNRAVELDLMLADISDQSVQAGRDEMTRGGRNLHDYVPLFFRPLTPMQYVICVHHGKRDEVAMIEVDPIVFALDGVIFTDGNARSNESKDYSDISDLELLDWDILNTPDAWSREYKRKKSAEVLVPHVVPVNYIRRVCVTSTCKAPPGLAKAVAFDNSLFPWE